MEVSDVKITSSIPDKIRILLIDDDEDDFVITKDIILDIPGRNYLIEWASSFEEGLALIRAKKHDVYLVDFFLGAHNGLELITQAVMEGTTAPMILLTGQTDRETDEKAMQAGALDFLVKGSITPYDLERSIRYSIDHAKSLAEIQTLNAQLEQRVQERTQELAEANQQLETTNRILSEAQLDIEKALQKEKELNELKSRFVTTASHEFRTPLSTVLSSASIIARYKTTEEDDKRLKHVDRIKSAVQNLTVILNDFLSMSRIEEGKVYNVPSVFNLVSFSDEVVEEMQALVKEGQSIDYVHEGSQVLVEIDKQLLKNILINLLSNASKYSNEGKTIYLHTKITPQAVTLSVKDEGIGIPPSDQTHLFTPFFRAQNATNIQGTGLGLNIVKRYVEVMQGNMQFASVLNKGSAFTITFPKKTKK